MFAAYSSFKKRNCSFRCSGKTITLCIITAFHYLNLPADSYPKVQFLNHHLCLALDNYHSCCSLLPFTDQAEDILCNLALLWWRKKYRGGIGNEWRFSNLFLPPFSFYGYSKNTLLRLVRIQQNQVITESCHSKKSYLVFHFINHDQHQKIQVHLIKC